MLSPASVSRRVPNHSGLRIPAISRLRSRMISGCVSDCFLDYLCTRPIIDFVPGRFPYYVSDRFYEHLQGRFPVLTRNRGNSSRPVNQMTCRLPVSLLSRSKETNYSTIPSMKRPKKNSVCGGKNFIRLAPTGSFVTARILGFLICACFGGPRDSKTIDP